jgi:Tfp pilus assembly protein PilV
MVKQRTLNFGMRNAECRIFRNLHSKIRNEKGIALVMVLVMSAIALAVMAGLIYMVITGTQISGTQKKYETAKEAGLGGTDITYEFIALRGDPATVSALLTELYAINPAVTTSSSCTGTNISGTSFTGLAAKLNTRTTNTDGTSNWSAICYGNSMDIYPGTPATYDMRFDLGTTPSLTYRVYAKIVNTAEGNSGLDEGLGGKGVVSTGEITVVSKPYLYTLEVDAENLSNPSERAKYSILYQY